MEPGDNVRHGFARARVTPGRRKHRCTWREGGDQIGLLDNVLSADLVRAEPAAADPAPDCLWVTVNALRSFGYG